MSIQFNWEKLTEDSEQIEKQISQFLHEQFQAVQLPPFISSLAVSSFKLGSVPPEITLKHFSDPFPEFIEAGRELDEAEDDSDTSGTHTPDSPARHIPDTHTPEARHTPDMHTPEARHSREYASTPPDTQLSSQPGTPHVAGTPHAGTPHAGTLNYAMLDDNESEPETEPGPFDIQTYVELKYAGDMQLAISATLLLNYPAPSFISLPLSIKVTNIDVHSLIVVAVVRDRVHLSVLNDVARDDAPPADRVNVIRGMKIESEIGDHADHGAMLRNVGKVEKFVLEQLRNVIRDELVWPGWLTLEL